MIDLRSEFQSEIGRWSAIAFKTAFAVLRNKSDAEEITQEAMLRAYQRLSQLRERDRACAWLSRIAWRLALNHLRANRARMQRHEMATRVSCQAQTAIDELIVRERSSRLWTAINSLPEDLRSATVLVSIEQRSVREAAEILQVADGTIKSRLFRARQMLKRMLSTTRPSLLPVD